MLHEITIRGTVQGVGFRPFIFRAARRFDIRGEAANTPSGVRVLAEAEEPVVEAFIKVIKEEHPPLALVKSVEVSTLDAERAFTDFSIVETARGHSGMSMIPPDMATCPACLKELTDPSDRRFSYPFINCTDCGPRFTIVRSTPYDRPFTSMNEFAMCPECMREYGDPADRRFHAEPNACPVCGPSISWHHGHGRVLDEPDPINAAVQALRGGLCVAIRGLGGFHLAVDAASDSAVALLRKRKNRPHKPFAVMARDLASVCRLCHVSTVEAEALESTRAPIVLLRLKKEASGRISRLVAPCLDEAGVMLPYTPVHHMIFRHESCPSFLIMTSGNPGGEPICSGSEEAFEKLCRFADYFLIHNREIVNRVDDSVVRVMGGGTKVFRRARGYVPEPLYPGRELPGVLACGADLKNTFCLAKDSSAVMGQHCGDLFNTASYDFFMENIKGMQELTGITPEIVACDLHPDYMSSRYARSTGLPLFKVQHHHAHAVAVMAEHNIEGPVIAVVLDGTGYGEDGTVWGGEILLATTGSYRRLAHLEHLAMPGGDRAAREIWRLGLSAMFRSYGRQGRNESAIIEAMVVKKPSSEMILEMIERGFNTPLTSSCGRLFDAVASILGIRQTVDYEGQAAMELEAFASEAAMELERFLVLEPDYCMPVRLARSGGLLQIVTSDMVSRLVHLAGTNLSPSMLALSFHDWLIRSVEKAVLKITAENQVKDVVLSGGCFQNRLLLEGVIEKLEKDRLRVFTGVDVPMNDGGISLGQAVVAGINLIAD